MEYWSAGVLECWSDGVMECWSDGVLECWSIGMLEYCMKIGHGLIPEFDAYDIESIPKS
jgi:hypothetical protein